jgi:hypothetical protein
MSNTFPSSIYIIRHGEKLGDASSDKDGGPDLSIQGSARAAALPSLFVPTDVSCPLTAGTGNFSGQYITVSAVKPNPPRFQKPDFIFATQKSNNSNRPVETVTPLSITIGLTINSGYANSTSGIDALAKAILGGQYAGKVVLICWHHGEIPAVATALGVSKPPKWKSSAFDFLWQVTYSPKGKANLKIHHQKLLYGDAK